MDLAKPAIDIGLYTDDLDAGLQFWQREVGLPFEELLPVGRGVQQHRHGLHGAVLKLNHSRDPLSDGPSGLRGLTITRPGDGNRSLTSPEGVEVALVDGSQPAVEVLVAVSDLDGARRWWVDGLGADEHGPDRYQLGETRIAVSVEPARLPTEGILAKGFRYLTVQVRQLEAEHARLVAMGFGEGLAPIRLGDVAYISMVRSPDGDWLELSQRASLTGALPEDVPRAG